METLKLFPEREVANQRGFHRKPLTAKESKKALDFANRGMIVVEPKVQEKPVIEIDDSIDVRQTYCNEKIAKAIEMVLKNGGLDHFIHRAMIEAAQEWYTRNHRNGRAKLSTDDAESLIARLYTLEHLPNRKGTITPKVMDDQAWRAHKKAWDAQQEAEQLAELEAALN